MSPPRIGGLSARLAAGTPAARAEATFGLLRGAVALAGASTLLVTVGQAHGQRTAFTVAVWLHLLVGVASLAAVVPLSRLRTDASARRVARVATVLDVLLYTAYTIGFAAHPGAGTTYGVFVLLIGPVRWGWRGALVTGLPVALVATFWPQQDITGATYGTVQTWLLIALFTVPAAAITTLSRRAGGRLRQAQEQFRTAFEHASIGMALLDEDLCLLQVNRSLGQLLGAAEEDLLGTPLDEHVVPEDAELLRRALGELSSVRPATRLEVRLARSDGQPRWGLVAASWLAGSSGVPSRVVLQVENITDRKESEARLSHLATHDGLTGLPNRAMLRSRMDGALERGDRLGVLFLDLDRFKIVNDGLGHAAGDALLVAAADRLSQVVRPGDFVARIGGDEFVMLCYDAAAEEDLVRIGVRVLAALRPPVHLEAGSDVVIGASIGAAMAHADDTADSLLRDADTAMYAAKAAGGARVQMFTESLHHAALRTHELETDLRRAVREDGLRLVYQPIVDLATGRVSGLEALVRWYHPLRGSIRPSEFVPVAEQSELIVELGTWVLRRAMLDAASWPRGIGAPTTVSVNVSPRQLTTPGFPELVEGLLAETGLPGSRLCLELTETALVGDVAPVVHALRAIRDLDIRVAIDDFGTGHASLSYLTQFPVDTVKVDQTFVAGVATDAGSAAIVGGVVAMAHAFGLRVVAEGAETPEQLAQLRRLGCEFAQGYVLASPMAADAAAGILGAAAGIERLVPAPRESRSTEPRGGLDEARRYRLLLDCARDVSACLDLDSVLERSFLALRKVVNFDGGSIQLVEGNVVRLAATDPPAPPEALEATVPLGKGISGTIAATGEPRYLPDITIVASVQENAKRNATSGGVRSYYGVPLLGEGRVIGVLQVDSTEVDAFDEQDRLLVLSFASVVASAVQTARLFAMELSMMTDERPR
ncbi:MAG: two-component system response regulator [Frankiales bacterium]|nr:two-component system response regulator [Frankiales bacterium]